MEVSRTGTDRLLHTAMSGLALRQRVITDNVANASTPGFKASAVEFEGAMRQAIARGDASKAPDADGFAGVSPQVVTLTQTSRGVDGNNVDIDQQMVELAQTNITYNALSQLAAARSRVLRNVIREGHG